MVLDAVSVRNLEMVEPLFAGEGETLLGALDQTMTGMGGRLLRQRLLRPSLDRAEIEARLDAAGELLQQTILRAELPGTRGSWTWSACSRHDGHCR
jgi:DNA mismatch repair protein MutS